MRGLPDNLPIQTASFQGTVKIRFHPTLETRKLVSGRFLSRADSLEFYGWAKARDHVCKKKIVSKEVVSGQLSQILFIPIGESSVVFKASYSHFDLFQYGSREINAPISFLRVYLIRTMSEFPNMIRSISTIFQIFKNFEDAAGFPIFRHDFVLSRMSAAWAIELNCQQR